MDFMTQLNLFLEPVANVALLLILPTLYKHELRIKHIEMINKIRNQYKQNKAN